MARIKLTRKVKRGLALMRGCMIEFADDRGRSWQMVVRTWRKSEESDFNAAMAWIEQCEADEAKPEEGPEALKELLNLGGGM